MKGGEGGEGDNWGMGVSTHLPHLYIAYEGVLCDFEGESGPSGGLGHLGVKQSRKCGSSVGNIRHLPQELKLSRDPTIHTIHTP